MDKIFMVGIAGSGMKRLAEIYKALGYDVYGIDVKENADTEYLRSIGIKVNEPYVKLDNTFKSLIVSSAIPEDNEFVKVARALDIPVIKRGEALANLSKNFKSIVVAGTHGKTSTTSLIAEVLSGGFKVNAYIGGNHERNKGFVSNADYFVVESDESDRTFLLFNPFIGVITSIDKDHLNAYNWDFNVLKNAFKEFLMHSDVTVLNIDDPNIHEIAKDNLKETYFYSLYNKDAHAYVEDVRFEDATIFTAKIFNESYKFSMKTYGEKYLLNAIGSLLVAKILNVDFNKVQESLNNFTLPKRRLEYFGKIKGVSFFDDHADHPTEVYATLSALRTHFPNNRIIAIFEPHRYTRVFSLKEEIAKPFKLADIVVVLPIFSAFEKPIEGINSEVVFNWIKENNKEKLVLYAEDYDTARDLVLSLLKENDIVVTLGPGNVNFVLEKILIKFR